MLFSKEREKEKATDIIPGVLFSTSYGKNFDCHKGCLGWL